MRQLFLGIKGQEKQSKVCATCLFWEGDVLKNKCNRFFHRFEIDDTRKYDLCVKRHRNTNCLFSCSQHQYHYRLQKYR